ncbi:DNA-binding MarR family transcriptional regulator [Pseudonocardia hierapolitana]|uniref:DNA-binding MarR family transcriptional regulator n=1 Tax=Pseudonocardia hierapolitana TaxID=1128676 RepID=A0A561T274_9PSEU|nr:MarR family transcriptional regulator [Pseudonocardia hierapolitana]TWF81208.1 DNA-binding MarR family transcriptional regulator [Pseudonocardia hierapolitana]
MEDAVDRILGQWRRERPDDVDDLWPMGLVGRIQRLDRILDRELKAFYATRDLELWEADVLLTLRRSGAPYALTPGALLKAAMITSGAMTNRIDRLEAKGLVQRSPGPDDRRSVRVQLTPRALELIDEFFAEHMANEARLFAALTAGEREQLAALLRTALHALGDTDIT